MSYVFGPVPSRRLGRSLGIDVIPFKTCTYDCVYCQLGKTTRLTRERCSFVPYQDIVEEVRQKLEAGVQADYLTLSGSGEPTLYTGLGSLIEALKTLTSIPIAVLTNGSLLGEPSVQKDMAEADIVIPSLDAGDSAGFEKINRPCEGISFPRMIAGLTAFRNIFQGEIWLEVMILEGLSSDQETLEHMKRYIEEIRPDRVQLNTVARPPAEAIARPVSPERLREIAAFLGGTAQIVEDFQSVHNLPEVRVTRDEVLTLLQRRPCSIKDIADGLGIHRNEAVKHVQHLLEKGAIISREKNNTIFYVPVQETPNASQTGQYNEGFS